MKTLDRQKLDAVRKTRRPSSAGAASSRRSSSRVAVASSNGEGNVRLMNVKS